MRTFASKGNKAVTVTVEFVVASLITFMLFPAGRVFKFNVKLMMISITWIICVEQD